MGTNAPFKHSLEEELEMLKLEKFAEKIAEGKDLWFVESQSRRRDDFFVSEVRSSAEKYLRLQEQLSSIKKKARVLIFVLWVPCLCFLFFGFLPSGFKLVDRSNLVLSWTLGLSVGLGLTSLLLLFLLIWRDQRLEEQVKKQWRVQKLHEDVLRLSSLLNCTEEEFLQLESGEVARRAREVLYDLARDIKKVQEEDVSFVPILSDHSLNLQRRFKEIYGEFESWGLVSGPWDPYFK